MDLTDDAGDEVVVSEAEQGDQWKRLADEFKVMAGERHDTLGDGWCWMWSFCGSFGLLESPINPTTLDYKFVAAVLRDMMDTVSNNCQWISMGDRDKFMKMKPPPFKEGLDLANYGGPRLLFKVLAWVYRVPILTIDDRDLDASETPARTTGPKQVPMTHTTASGRMSLIRHTVNRAPSENHISMAGLVQEMKSYEQHMNTEQYPAVCLFNEGLKHYGFMKRTGAHVAEPPEKLTIILKRVKASLATQGGKGRSGVKASLATQGGKGRSDSKLGQRGPSTSSQRQLRK
jgi:hypothetical protein